MSNGPHLVVEGSGPPVVLVHGGLVASEWWEWLSDALSDACTVVRYDQPGYGKSRSVEGGGTISSYVRYLVSIIQRLGAPRVTLIGFSFGGMVAIQAAAQLARRVHAVIMIGSGLRLDPDAADLVRARAARIERTGNLDLAEHVRLAFSTGFAKTHPALLDRYLQSITVAPHLLAATFRSIAATDCTAVTSTLRCPVLALAGAEDRLFGASALDDIRMNVPQCHTVLLDGAGHTVHLERPADVARVVRSFLSETRFLEA